MQDAIDALVANPGGSEPDGTNAAGGSQANGGSKGSTVGGGGGGGGGSWNVTLADVCLKPMGADCATQSVLQYWGMSREAFEHGGWVGGWVHRVPLPCHTWEGWQGQPCLAALHEAAMQA